MSSEIDSQLPIVGSRAAFALYCEEIRTEVTGQSSFVGVYGDELVFEELPYVLPRLAIFVNLWTPGERPFKDVVVRILLNDAVLREEKIDTARLNFTDVTHNFDANPRTRWSLRMHIAFSPFVVPHEGALRVRIQADGEEFRAGGLLFKTSATGKVVSDAT